MGIKWCHFPLLPYPPFRSLGLWVGHPIWNAKWGLQWLGPIFLYCGERVCHLVLPILDSSGHVGTCRSLGMAGLFWWARLLRCLCQRCFLYWHVACWGRRLYAFKLVLFCFLKLLRDLFTPSFETEVLFVHILSSLFPWFLQWCSVVSLEFGGGYWSG